MVILADERPENADWPKRTWDLPIENKIDRLEYLKAMGMTVEQFKKLPVYRWNVEKLLWLKEL
jgi:hypothetical protein